MARAILESEEQSTGTILIFFHLACVSFSSCTFYGRTIWVCHSHAGVAIPSIVLLYPSRTSSLVYISAEQHREYIFQPNSIARIYFSRTASYVRIRIL